MSAQRIQRKRTAGWRMPEGAVYVGRPSRWGNPFPVREPFTREDTVRMYRELIVDGEAWWTDGDESSHRFSHWHGRHAVPTAADIRAALAGRDLACWCPLSSPCHADVLLELANAEARS